MMISEGHTSGVLTALLIAAAAADPGRAAAKLSGAAPHHTANGQPPSREPGPAQGGV
jgi:hypothetical protein